MHAGQKSSFGYDDDLVIWSPSGSVLDSSDDEYIVLRHNDATHPDAGVQELTNCLDKLEVQETFVVDGSLRISDNELVVGCRSSFASSSPPTPTSHIPPSNAKRRGRKTDTVHTSSVRVKLEPKPLKEEKKSNKIERGRNRSRSIQSTSLISQCASPEPTFPVFKENSSVGDSSAYEDASFVITSYLASPIGSPYASEKLSLLQALIVELGLTRQQPSLPASVKAAKAFLKAHVHVNISEYLDARGKDQDALQRILYPSRSALIKSIRTKRNPASLQTVKAHGLQALLVSCYHSK